MFDKDKILFSLVGLIGDDDMLFPDWTNAQEILLDPDGWPTDNYTVTQDSFLIALYSEESAVSPNGVVINGKNLFRSTYGTAVYNRYPCFYCTKGTFLKNTSNTNKAIFKAIPLVKSGGGLKSYYCLLKAQPKVLFFVTGE